MNSRSYSELTKWWSIELMRYPETGLDWFDCDMFHGGRLKQNGTYPRDENDDEPVKLWRNAFFIPPVFKPQAMRSLVVRKDIAMRLREIGAVVDRCEFAMVINHPYPGFGVPADLEEEIEPDVYRWVERHVLMEVAEGSKHEYYRVQCSLPPEGDDVRLEYESFGLKYMRLVNIKRMSQYPVWIGPGFMVTEAAKVILDTYVDERVFALKKLIDRIGGVHASLE
jgi:hypothetical protein